MPSDINISNKDYNKVGKRSNIISLSIISNCVQAISCQCIIPIRPKNVNKPLVF